MRAGRDPKLLIEGGKVIGLSFGADYCAEHEIGIEPIKMAFRVRSQIGLYGLERRVARSSPSDLCWFRHSKGAEGFALCGNGGLPPTMSKELVGRKGTKLSAAWRDHSFAAVAKDRDTKEVLRTLLGAMERMDAAVFLSRDEPYAFLPGLTICVASSIPRSVVDHWENKDREWYALQLDFQASGIAERLRVSRKVYYSLRPSRASDGTLRIWLNPVQQNLYTAGWYTVEELEAWAENKGPVLKPLASRLTNT